MDKKSKNTLIVSIIALALVLIGVTYAYFSARITGLESASMIQLTAGRMGIVYSEGDENVTMNNIYPREEAWVTKTFTLTGYNTTDKAMNYKLGLNVITNTFTNNYLTYDLIVLDSDSGTPISEKTGKVINGTGFISFGKGTFLVANGDKHIYQLKIYFKDNGKDQNDAQEAVFNAKIDARETIEYNCSLTASELQNTVDIIDTYTINHNACMGFIAEYGFDDLYSNEEAETICDGGTITLPEEYSMHPTNFDGFLESCNSDIRRGYEIADDCYFVEQNIITNIGYKSVLALGAEHIEGQYKYYYGMERTVANSLYSDQPGTYLEQDGWSVVLADYESSDPITSRLCTHIDGKPVISMATTYAYSLATSIDLSSFETSNITNMEGMFAGSPVTSLDLSSFNTSNVTKMFAMFRYMDNITSLDLSSFDTSNVTDMQNMFERNMATSLNISGFDTSNVTNMEGMFLDSRAASIDLSSFNTSNVNFMGSMFDGFYAQTLDLSNFDTSNVTDMHNMFRQNKATSIDLSSFNTSRVTTMSSMFSGSQITNIDLSSFDTQRLIYMTSMFEDSNASVIDLSSFNTLNVVWMPNLFKDSNNLTTIYVSNNFVTSSVSASLDSNMFTGCTSLVGGAGTAYNSSYVNRARAHIDGGVSNPGYFTDIAYKP